jgi:hypothetical protein
MKFSFDAIVRLTLNHEKGSTTSTHIATDLRLEPGRGLDLKQYLDHGRATKEGSRVLTKVLVSGLAANIHAAHQKGYKDSAEHMREIIAELERQFIEPAKVIDGFME